MTAGFMLDDRKTGGHRPEIQRLSQGNSVSSGQRIEWIPGTVPDRSGVRGILLTRLRFLERRLRYSRDISGRSEGGAIVDSKSQSQFPSPSGTSSKHHDDPFE